MAKKGIFKVRIESDFGDVIKNNSKSSKEFIDFLDIMKKKFG